MNRLFTVILLTSISTIFLNAQEISISYQDVSYFIDTTSFELKSNLQDGEYKVYKDSLLTQLQYQGEIQSSIRIGTWVWYFQDGTVKREIVYSSGIISGLLKSYYPSGHLSSSMQYSNGLRSGEMKRWYDSGELKLEGYFVNGAPSGTWKYWKSDGTLIKEEEH